MTSPADMTNAAHLTADARRIVAEPSAELKHQCSSGENGGVSAVSGP
jgi:hypothetical protein